MSFALTTDQILNRTKDVTRRRGWWFLEPGDELVAVEKIMGMRRGQSVKPLCKIKVVSTQREPLNVITPAEVLREGFPELSPEQFIEMFCSHMRCRPSEEVNRIEFEYL
jgi:hypothetical protein